MRRLAMQRMAGLIVCLAALGSVSAALAETPTGTWKWTRKGRNDQTRETTLTLKLDGDKLTGSMPGRNNQERAIEEGTFKNDEVSFKITRERDGRKFTTNVFG